LSTLETLRPGDKVLHFRGHNEIKIATVEKVGKIHITIDGGVKFNKRGWLVGGSTWNRTYLHPYDEDKWRNYVIERANKKVIRDLDDFKWCTLNIELARKIHAMLPKPEKTEVND
jgi:hypothetical protein